MTGVKSHNEIKGTGLWGAIVVLLGGIGVATYQTYIKLRLQNEPSFKSSCNQGDAFNCDAVMTSTWSEIGGIPISLFAIPASLIMIFLAYRGIKGQPSPGKMWVREEGVTALRYMALIGLVSCLHSTYLFYISAVFLKTFCIYCVALYVVNFISTALAVWASPESPKDVFSKGLEAVFSIKEPLVSTLLLFFLVGGLTFAVYADKKGDMAGDRFDAIDELFADEEFEEVETSREDCFERDPLRQERSGVVVACTPREDFLTDCEEEVPVRAGRFIFLGFVLFCLDSDSKLQINNSSLSGRSRKLMVCSKIASSSFSHFIRSSCKLLALSPI